MKYLNTVAHNRIDMLGKAENIALSAALLMKVISSRQPHRENFTFLHVADRIRFMG